MSIDEVSGKVFTGPMDGTENGLAVADEKTGFTLHNFVDLGSSRLVRELEVTMDGDTVVIRGRCSYQQDRTAARKAAEQWLQSNGLLCPLRMEISQE